MYVVGIDPGARKNIGVAAVKVDHTDAIAEVVSGIEELKWFLEKILKEHDIIQAYVEQPTPVVRPERNENGKPIWNMPLVRVFGEIRGLLYGMNISCVTFTAKKWQKKFFGNRKGKKHNKEMSLQQAKREFPKLTKAIGRNHNIADALLIAEYGRRYILRVGEKVCGKGQY